MIDSTVAVHSDPIYSAWRWTELTPACENGGKTWQEGVAANMEPAPPAYPAAMVTLLLMTPLSCSIGSVRTGINWLQSNIMRDTITDCQMKLFDQVR